MDYVRRHEVIIVVINIEEYIENCKYWIDLEDLKQAYLKFSEVGVIRFIEENSSSIGKL